MKVILQPFLRQFEGQSQLLPVLVNIGWLVGDNILRTGVKVIVGIWLARYLGPEKFGLLSFAGALVAIFAGLATLGLGEILIRDLVRHPERKEHIIGTSFVLQFAAGCACFLALFVTARFARPGEPGTLMVVLIVGAILFVSPLATIRNWFLSQVSYKYVVLAENSASLAVSAVRALLILAAASVVAFAWATVAEVVLMAFGLIVMYIRTGNTIDWKFRRKIAVSQLRETWPLAAGLLAYTLYGRVDQVMLGQMLGDAKVGVYAAAVRVAELWLFIPPAISSSFFPSLVSAREANPDEYRRRLQQLFNLMVVLGVGASVVLSFSANWIVGLLFGSEYSDAGPVLQIYSWAGIFVGFAWMGERYLVIEGLQRLVMYRHLIGAIINVTANWLLIPTFGLVGAAWASIATYAIANYLVDVLDPRTRPMFTQKSRALFWIWAFPGASGRVRL